MNQLKQEHNNLVKNLIKHNDLIKSFCKKYEHKNSNNKKLHPLLPSVLSKYDTDDLIDLAENIGVKPYELLEILYDSNDIINILELKEFDTKTTLLHINRIAGTLLKIGLPYVQIFHNSKILFSILGISKIYCLYKRLVITENKKNRKIRE